MPWAIKWSSNSPLDVPREHLMGGAAVARPPEFSGYKTMVFATRILAREFIAAKYGYLASRPDLRARPFCWRQPKAVKVTVRVTEIRD